MNVYDFDGTIYKGESVLDFYFFCLKKDFRFIRYMMVVLPTWYRYKRCKISESELEQIAKRYATEYVRRIPDVDAWVKEFWNKNERKIKNWYLKQQQEDDIIISASFDVLLAEICQRKGINHYISSVIDPKSGEVTALCFRKNKRKMWEENYPGMVPENFYTDSELDTPMMKLAVHGYKVSGESVKKVK